METNANGGASAKEYAVVARRYRPQSFDDLVGQSQVTIALENAIKTNRVGHAYLFTGARGVGKTSAARIFAKRLNCQDPTTKPCNQCDICDSISIGEDIDVLEIDGASNRGIDEIRQLRANVNVRPSRCQYKIYIIDEVHMLTTPAFNALLKTLEEPPPHVKFIFCTTDPEKIPITVLSRCQRFDFPPIDSNSIVERLKFIVNAEERQATPEALEMLARRAGGSMRDSQSLLEQLLAFTTGTITADHVHSMLGTADIGRLLEIGQQLLGRDAAGSLTQVDAAVRAGVDVGQLTEQLIGFLRDSLTAAVGCGPEMLLHLAPSDHQQLVKLSLEIGRESLLAMLQILDQCMARMRLSNQHRVLLEVALVRICELENLDDIATLVERLNSGVPIGAPTSQTVPPRPETQKKNEISLPADDTPPQSSGAVPSNVADFNSENIDQVWQQMIDSLEDMTADMLRYYDHVAILGPNQLAVRFKAGYTLQKQSCDRPDRKQQVESRLGDLVGKPIAIQFELVESEEPAEPIRATPTRRQRLRETEQNPLVKEAVELFDGELVRVDEPRKKNS